MAETNTEQTPEVTRVRERTPRLVQPAEGTVPANEEEHTRWALDNPARVRRLQQMGYRIAKPEDVKDGHDGHLDGSSIRKDDLVLMVSNREPVEKRRRARFMEEQARDRQAHERGELDRLRDIEPEEIEDFHGGRGRKYYY